MNRIFESVPVDEQGIDAALAVLRMTRRYSADAGRSRLPASRSSPG